MILFHSSSLCADPPSSAAGRTLTLVAKSVQNLANLVEFGAKVRFLKLFSLSFFAMGMYNFQLRDFFFLNFLFFNSQNQEPYMEGVNPFIKSNKHRMIMFLDELGVSKKKSFLPFPPKKKQKTSTVFALLWVKINTLLKRLSERPRPARSHRAL